MYTVDETLLFLEAQSGDMVGIDPITYLSGEVAEAFDLSSGIYPGVSTEALNDLHSQSREVLSRPHYWSKVRAQLLAAADATIEQTRVYIESPKGLTETSFGADSDREYAKQALANFLDSVRYLKALPEKPTRLQLKVCSMIFQLDSNASLGALPMGTLWDSESKLHRLTNEYLLKPSDELLDSYVEHVLRYYANSWDIELAEDEAVGVKVAQETNAKLIAELDTLRLLDECDL